MILCRGPLVRVEIVESRQQRLLALVAEGLVCMETPMTAPTMPSTTIAKSLLGSFKFLYIVQGC